MFGHFNISKQSGLDNHYRWTIIIEINTKYREEDEYMLEQRPREQDQVKTCPPVSVEWTSE
jgi:hypothetical protein